MQMHRLMRGHRSRKRLSVCVTEVNELVVHVPMYKGHQMDSGQKTMDMYTMLLCT